MKNEIELLNQTEADLLMLMKQYKSGQYSHLADCITRVRTVRESLRLLTPLAVDKTICHCSHDNYENVVNPGHCMNCGKPFRH